MAAKFTADDFKSAPVSGPVQQDRKWSMSTLYAARPNPKWDTRPKAEAWNKRYADVPKLQVDLDEFRETIPETPPEIVEAHWERLRQLSRTAPKLKVVDAWEKPE